MPVASEKYSQTFSGQTSPYYPYSTDPALSVVPPSRSTLQHHNQGRSSQLSDVDKRMTETKPKFR